MATIRLFEMSEEDLQRYMNTTIDLLASRMAEDGLVADPSDVTNRYLAMVVRKSSAAKMFNSLFGNEAKNDDVKLVVVRVDNKVKVEDNK